MRSISPALADDLSGLPATWIGTGSLDLFFDEALDYARRLARSGVPVALSVYQGGIHGFDMVGEAACTHDLGQDRMRAWRRALRPETR